MIGVEVDLKARKVAKDKNSEQVGEGRAFDAWRDLCASWGSPPLQPHVKSRSGGWHFYYKPPPGVDVKRLRQRGLVKLPGFDQHVIETRVNGFLLIPPSEFGGQAYTYWSSFHDAPYEASPQLIGALEDVRAQPGNTPPASIVKPGSYDLRDFAKYVCKVHHQAGMPREVWRATIFAMVAQYGRYVAYQIAQAIHDGEPQTSYQIENLVSYASEEFNPGDSTFKTLFKHAHENGIPDSMRPSAAAMFGSPAPILDIDAILAEIDAEVPSPPPPPTGGTPLIGGPRPTPRAPEYGETQIAERFATDYANALRYITSSGSWFHWTGKRWKRDDTDYAVHLVSKHCVAEATLCAGTPGYTAANARTLCSNGTVNAVAQIARKDPRIATTADQWDSDPMLLGTPEGIVDLKTGTLRPARPEDCVTKSTAVTSGGDCPTFRAFLAQATNGDVELQKYVQRLFGYALTGSIKEEAMFFAHGPGGSGKGTLMHAIIGILGEYHVGTSIQTFTESKYDRHPAELAALHGSRMVTCSETERGRHWAESRIKELTGGDTIAARFMGQDWFNFVPTFKIVISGNYKPSMRPDAAMRRRFQLIPFTAKIPEHKVDRNLGTKLKAEWPGILAWAIQGCLAWQQDGLQPPAAVLAATKAYFDDEAEDILDMWLQDGYDLSDVNAKTPRKALYASYKSYAEQAGERPVSAKQFKTELLGTQAAKEAGIKSTREGAGNVIHGLKLKPHAAASTPATSPEPQPTSAAVPGLPPFPMRH